MPPLFSYSEAFSRNFGRLTQPEQDQLRRKWVVSADAPKGVRLLRPTGYSGGNRYPLNASSTST
jgi:hypothetical protein